VTDLLPREVSDLFWDVDPDDIELRLHGDYVMERVMARGGWTAMVWLRRSYGREALADFLQRKASRLAPRERAYWSLMAGIEVPLGPGGARPPWAGR
jgi:hypothetical protein